MHDDRSDEDRVFRALKGRPTDELDSSALWRRIEGDLAPRAASWIDRAAAIGLGGLQPATLRLAGVGAVALLVVGVVWLAPGMTGPEAPSELVPLTGPVDAAAADTQTAESQPDSQPEPQPGMILDVRLVRGYSGTLPADAMVSAGAGAGGADRLADLRGALDGFLLLDQLALVGQWRGAVGAGEAGLGQVATLVRLSSAFGLRFAAQRTGTGVTLADVRLDGAGRPLVADELVLTPGRPYLFGVQAEGEDSDTGSLVLAVSVLPAPVDVDEPVSQNDAARPSAPDQR